jgi:uncharacterized protein YbaP (TraB family)
MKLIYIIAAAFIFQSCKSQTPAVSLPQNKDDNSLLWQISGKELKQPSYVFGTFHLLCKDDIHFSANLLQAVKNADEVYFELKLDDPAVTMGGMFFLNMTNGQTLQDLFTAAEYSKVKKFFSDSLKMNIDFFNRMKPMMLESLLYPRMMPCKSPSGSELELMSVAKKDKKQIKGMETVQFQAAIFDSIPYEVQAKALLKDIDSADKNKVMFSEMVNIYKSQQISRFTEMMKDSTFSEGEDDDLLLKKRNLNWVAQLDTILPKESIFMAVGAAHLFGENGLIALLRKDGYTVMPVENVK